MLYADPILGPILNAIQMRWTVNMKILLLDPKVSVYFCRFQSGHFVHSSNWIDYMFGFYDQRKLINLHYLLVNIFQN